MSLRTLCVFLLLGIMPAPAAAQYACRADSPMYQSWTTFLRNASTPLEPDRACGHDQVRRQAEPSWPYRLVVEVSAAKTTPWHLVLRSGRGGPELRLSEVNAAQGGRFLSPELNSVNDGYCAESANSPEVMIRWLIKEEGAFSQALGVEDKDPNKPPNFVPAREIEAHPDRRSFAPAATLPGCTGFPAVAPTPLDLWTDQDTQLELSRKERIERAAARMVWIGLEDSEYEEFRHCSGFFIGTHVIATARHCVERPNGSAAGYTLRGWLRPTGGGPNKTAMAPDLQHLSVVAKGAPCNGNDKCQDFALLHVDDTVRDDGKQIELPEPTKLVDWGDKADGKKLTVVQYPYGSELVLNFDEDCIGRGIKSERNNPQDEPDSYHHDKLLAHGCDTMSMSSGSPVYDRDLSEVGAIHVCCGTGPAQLGNLATDPDVTPNYAVPVSVLKLSLTAQYLKQSRAPSPDAKAMEAIREVFNASKWQLP